MSRAFPVARALAVAAAVSLSLTACGSEKNEEPQAQSSATPTSATKDGKLKIGTLLPETGSLAFTGPADMAAVKLALKEINAAGGVLGGDVTTVARDSGDAKNNIASQGAKELLDDGVDAIVGANSSSVTLNVLEQITNAGVLQISPGNTSTKLSDTAIDDGLYFRTAPSDIYQGRVVATTALEDGAESLGILALQDAYGTSLADQAKKVFTEGNAEMKPADAIIYDPEADEYAAEVGKIKDADPDAILLISLGGPDSAKFIEEMYKQGLLPLSKSGKKLYFVDGNMSQEIKVTAGALEGVKGTLPGSAPTEDFRKKLQENSDKTLTDFSYSGESYDAVMLVALAAEAAKSDVGKDIAAKMKDVSSGGEKCTTFADCVKLVKDGKDIDYDGVSGQVDFADNGDPSWAAMGVYQFGADNKFSPLKFFKGPISGGKLTTETVKQTAPSSAPSATPTSTSSSSSSSSSGSSSGSSSTETSASPKPSATASATTSPKP